MMWKCSAGNMQRMSSMMSRLATFPKYNFQPKLFCSTLAPSADKTDNEPTVEVHSTLLKELISRGFTYQFTDMGGLDKRLLEFEESNSTAATTESATKPKLKPKPLTMYVGFDATASSLHAGSLIQLMLARMFLSHGHRVICLLGGGTTKIGDPSGKDAARQMLSEEAIKYNCASIETVFRSVLGNVAVEAENLIIKNNSEWLDGLNYVSFLRDFGSQFSVNRMLSLDSVKMRLNREQPLSFLEFNYSILQAYDFHHLFHCDDVELQVGGSDQWGNIVSGVELINKTQHKCIAERKAHNKALKKAAGKDMTALVTQKEVPRFKQVYGLTTPLLTTSDGMKMGKSVNAAPTLNSDGASPAPAPAGGTIWLDRDLFSVFEYWSFWRSCSDLDVVRFLLLYTEVPRPDIAQIQDELAAVSPTAYGNRINIYKMVLADEATRLLHGCSDTEIAQIHAAAATLYSSSAAAAAGSETAGGHIPRVSLWAAAAAISGSGSDIRSVSEDLQLLPQQPIYFTDLLVYSGLAKSKNEGRRLIVSGAVRVNGSVKIVLPNDTVRMEHFDLNTTQFLLSCGKKKHVYAYGK